MKSIIKFISTPIINILINGITIYLFFNNYKFLVIYLIFAPIATGLIWFVHWGILKQMITKTLKDNNLTEGPHTVFYSVLYIIDMLTWVNCLIYYSKLIFEEKNV